eukprot:1871415-Rhodomonas_salina.1
MPAKYCQQPRFDSLRFDVDATSRRQVRRLRDNAPRFPWEAAPGTHGKSSVDMDVSQLIQYGVVNVTIPLHEVHGRK